MIIFAIAEAIAIGIGAAALYIYLYGFSDYEDRLDEFLNENLKKD